MPTKIAGAYILADYYFRSFHHTSLFYTKFPRKPRSPYKHAIKHSRKKRFTPNFFSKKTRKLQKRLDIFKSAPKSQRIAIIPNGFTAIPVYFISTYNKDLKLDLPLYLRLVAASRHDSVSAVVALGEFRKLYPYLTIDTFISDSASDNYATYELLHHWNIKAVIALNSTNKGNFKYPTHIFVNDNGTPICLGGNKMIYWGYCGKDRCRLKWRCPKACDKQHENCQNCSPSKYGRVIYTKPDWDLRLFTTIPRGSNEWKTKMNSRTACERVNNRILHDYGIETAKTRGKKRISFFTTIAAFNIHLDAQIRVLKSSDRFDFAKLFDIKVAA